MGVQQTHKPCRECLTEYPCTLEYFAPYYNKGYAPGRAPTIGVNCYACEEKVIKEGRALLKILEKNRAARKKRKQAERVALGNKIKAL